MDQVEREVQRRKRILEHAEETGNTAKTCRYFGIGRARFWRAFIAGERDTWNGARKGWCPRSQGRHGIPTKHRQKWLKRFSTFGRTITLGPR